LTSVTGRVPLDRISQRARAARPGRTVLAVVAGLLFGLGWLAFRACALAWLALAWCGSAVIEGWQASRQAETARRARAGRPG
jgi:uncharacterized membrane protein YedE/YeeE